MRNDDTMCELIMPPARPRKRRDRKAAVSFQACLLWLPLSLLACAGEVPEVVAPSADTVATWEGGILTLADIEGAFAEARTPACRKARRGGIEELLTCYRELAEGLAVERLVLSEMDNVDEALTELENYERLRRHAYLETWLRDRRDAVVIEDAELETHFKGDPGRYRRPGLVNLANIFRRHEDPARPEETVEFLRGLKERFAAGETFDALAREYSHSENRVRGGHVGQVTEDRLPERLRQVAFALGDGEVSDPVRVRDGAVLLHVRSVIAPVEPSVAVAEREIRRDLEALQVQRAISERVAGREPPADSVVLELDALVEALDSGDEERTVLDIAGDRLSVRELRRTAGLPSGPAADFDAETRDRLAERYFRETERRLLALELVESTDSELRAAAEDHLLREAVSELAETRFQAEMEQYLDEDAELVQGYFEDNRHQYQSPLRFKLKLWTVPFGEDPPGQLRRLEAVQQRLAAGDLDLTAAAGELGGSVSDLGWKEFEALVEEIPNKARGYLMNVGDSGFTVPYQQDKALHLIEVVEREDPQPLDYAEAVDRVRRDYLARFQKQLYLRVAEERLAATDFAFSEQAARRLLTPEVGTPE